MDKSIHGLVTPKAKLDENGHSEESDEGVVADHRPFNGVNQAIEEV